jgi:hypothetical protein
MPAEFHYAQPYEHNGRIFFLAHEDEHAKDRELASLRGDPPPPPPSRPATLIYKSIEQVANERGVSTRTIRRRVADMPRLGDDSCNAKAARARHPEKVG